MCWTQQKNYLHHAWTAETVLNGKYDSCTYQEHRLITCVIPSDKYFPFEETNDVQFRQKSIPIQFQFRASDVQFNSDSN